jgi:hypothetical protein
MEASFQHYRANNYDNRNKVIWNNTDFRIFNRDNPRSLGGPIPSLDETKMRAVLEQRKLLGYDHRMPLEDPEIRQKLLGSPGTTNALKNKDAYSPQEKAEI